MSSKITEGLLLRGLGMFLDMMPKSTCLHSINCTLAGDVKIVSYECYSEVSVLSKRSRLENIFFQNTVVVSQMATANHLPILNELCLLHKNDYIIIIIYLSQHVINQWKQAGVHGAHEPMTSLVPL